MRNEDDRERGRMPGHTRVSQVWPAHLTHRRLQTHDVQMRLQLLLRLPENSGRERQVAVRFLYRRVPNCCSPEHYSVLASRNTNARETPSSVKKRFKYTACTY